MESRAFDIIFAGGGTTACVIAGRLAAAHPLLKILVVESGQHSCDVPHQVQPYRYLENLLPTSTTVSWNTGKPSPHLNGRAPIVPSGRTVGGGSAINLMFYARGAASDYDDWATLGNKGWSFNELLPLIKKMERFTPVPDRPTHGYSGPVPITTAPSDIGVGSQLLDVAKSYDPTRPLVDDNNDFETANAYSPAYRYIDPDTGRRCDAASRYLYLQSGNTNLVILVGKRVKRVVIENGRAIGIEYMDVMQSQEGSGKLVTVEANKLVVVSAGAFGSPTILERSGIGATSILEKNKVSVLVDLPGVGENYRDHYGVCSPYYLSDETETMDDVWTNPEAVSVPLREWEQTGTGKIGHNGVEIAMKVRPSAAELTFTGSALRSRWKTFFESRSDKPMAMMITFSGYQAQPSARKKSTALYYLMYPDSTGSVHITSGEDANAPLDFDPDQLSKPGDVEQFTMMYKLTRELFRRIPAYRGEVAAFHPKFPVGSAAACRDADGPVSMDAPNIVYSATDDEAIADHHRDTIVTTCHSLGTCSMKSRDRGGVVDPRLNVYGVQGLKVADLSICPTNVGNNTCSTAILIGEKAAVIIAEDLMTPHIRRKL